jgi:ABC-type amino acid transport substrate-binding protein
MIRKVRSGALSAVIADDTILIPEANNAPDCALHVINEQIEPYDLSLGFRRTFGNPTFREVINEEILVLLENGVLNVRAHKCCSLQTCLLSW